MKIRIYSPFYPYPVTEGTFQTILAQALGFAEKHEVELVVWKSGPRPDQVEDPLRDKVKVIDWSQGAGKENKRQRLIRTFSSLFSEGSSSGLYYYPPSWDQRGGLGPCDLAIYHFVYAWEWLSRLSSKDVGEKKAVIHYHDIESDIFEYRASREANPIFRVIHRLNARKLRALEAKMGHYADEFWQVSPLDLSDTKSRHPEMKVPQMLRSPTYLPEVRHVQDSFFRKRRDGQAKVTLGFIGGLDFDPNRASLEWILTDLCPELKRRGFQGRVIAAGRNAPAELLSLGKTFSFFEYHGYVPDLNDFWSSLSMMLIPHVRGSGVRVKLLDALATGIPALANRRAIERIHPDLHSSPFLFHGESGSEWAEICMGLSAQELRKSLSSHPMDRALTFAHIYPEFGGSESNR